MADKILIDYELIALNKAIVKYLDNHNDIQKIGLEFHYKGNFKGGKRKPNFRKIFKRL